MRIIGIDPGTATVGWGVIEAAQGKLSAIAFGHLSTSKELPLEKRLAEIAADLRQLIRQYQPEEAGVEELFFSNNQKTALSVGQARGAILLTLEEQGIIIGGYTPLQVKQALTNYGKAAKGQVQLMVKALLKLDAIPQPDDAADALAIAICHANRRRMENIQKSK